MAFLTAGLARLTMQGWLVTRYRLRRGGGVAGQVIGTKVRSGIISAPGYTYWTARHAVVRYVDRTGPAHTMEAARDLPLGHLVPLACNPARPQRAAELTRGTRAARGGGLPGRGPGAGLGRPAH